MHLLERATSSSRHSRLQQRRPSRRPAIGARLLSDRARFAAFAAFMLLVAFTGGGSRPDILSLVILRPFAVLFSAYAVFAAGDRLRQASAPLLIVASLMALSLFQLVPLPSAIWTSLPQREAVAEASRLLGMEGLARPLSLDPNRTWNTFFALFVPLAAGGLSAIQAPAWRRLVVPVLMSVGLLSAMFGLLQVIGGDALQFYAVTNPGYPTGLFANKNHQSILLLWLMLAGSWLATMVDPRGLSAKPALASALALILVLFPLLILTGSRAGLFLSIPVLALCVWLLFRTPAADTIRRRAGRWAAVITGAVVALLAAPLVFVFAVLAFSGRRTALSRLLEVEMAQDLRWQYMPVMRRMALDYLPFGSGFGSFESAFNSYEPAEALTSHYMNQAHNDALQLVIEGGLPAVLIAVAALAWFASRLWRMWQSNRADRRTLAIFLGGSIVLWLVAGLVDYPLRTPLAAALVAVLTVQLALPSSSNRLDSGHSGDREAI